MNELLRRRIERKLESLPDERAYQILDYIEFLESRYGRYAATPSSLQQFAETVQNTLRAGKLPAAAIRGTMDVVGAAGRVMAGLAAAGKAVVEEVSKDEMTKEEMTKGESSSKLEDGNEA